MLSDAEIAEIRASGRDPDAVLHQLVMLRDGTRHRPIDRPCAIGDGILRLAEGEVEAAIERFNDSAARFGAFVPASGAASRMFANLSDDVVARVRTLAIWPSLGLDDDAPLSAIRAALESRWAGVPKGLVPFHAGGRTAFDEHLAEISALLPSPANGHFTVGRDHEAAFRDGVRGEVAVRFSHQDPRTDTIAVDACGALVRHQGRILFRPGGHGALIGNLQRTGFEFALIKNIDNVVPEARRHVVIRWRRAIGGVLVGLVHTVRRLLAELRGDVPGAEDRAFRFAETHLVVDVPHDRDALVLLLDRPLRVCGMVRNHGQPGGGPFFVRGSRVPQIIEGAEVDADDAEQQALWRTATHFNPVELAVALVGPEGPYDLARFADPDACIVSRKMHHGEPILVLEHPGLWNGQMARWNTVFVEIPSEAFRPVKTVGDLL